MAAATGLEEFVARRARTLAEVFLSRRPDVRLHEFEHPLLDFFATLDPEPGDKVIEFMQFGVAVRGTDRNVPDEVTAARSVQGWWPAYRKGAPAVRFFQPVLALLFSMQDDAGYHAWLARPLVEDNLPHIEMAERPVFYPIRKHSLDEIVAEVRAWYARLDSVVYWRE
ncbi:MAG: hypothetical protein K2P78_00540 [Gemmataceae bacterium]|nr:hypothetical protein [Gemmataceae bacterium]